MEPPHACCRSRSPSEPPFSVGASPYGASSRTLPHALTRCRTLPHAAGAAPLRSLRFQLEPPPMEPPHSSRTRSPMEPPHLQPVQPPCSLGTAGRAAPAAWSTGPSYMVHRTIISSTAAVQPPCSLGTAGRAAPATLVRTAYLGIFIVFRSLNLLRLRPLSSFSCRHGPHCCHGLHCLLRLDLIPEVLDAQPLAPSLVGGTCGRRPLSSSSTSLRHFRVYLYGVLYLPTCDMYICRSVIHTSSFIEYTSLLTAVYSYRPSRGPEASPTGLPSRPLHW